MFWQASRFLADSAKASRGPSRVLVSACKSTIDAASSFGLILAVRRRRRYPVSHVYVQCLQWVCSARRPSRCAFTFTFTFTFTFMYSRLFDGISGCRCCSPAQRSAMQGLIWVWVWVWVWSCHLQFRSSCSRVWGSASSSRHDMDGNHTSLFATTLCSTIRRCYHSCTPP
jgi:hypothetical protein